MGVCAAIGGKNQNSAPQAGVTILLILYTPAASVSAPTASSMHFALPAPLEAHSFNEKVTSDVCDPRYMGKQY